MNILRTEAATIIDICYVQQIAHNNIFLNFLQQQQLFFIIIYTSNIALSGEIIST
jgi:hypothetical protein